MNIHEKQLPLSSFGFGDQTNLFGPGVKETYSIYLVIDGQGKAMIDQTSHKLKKGDLLFVRPNQLHQIGMTMESLFQFCWISFRNEMDPQLFDSIQNDLHGQNVDVTTFQQIISMLIAMQQNDHLTDTKTWRNELLAKLFIQELYVQKELQNKAHRTNKITLIKEYIQAYYFEDLTVEGISNTFGMNRSYFCRLFKEVEGIAPKEYLLEYKIQKATELLHNPSLTVEQVSQSVGYHDTFNFSKMYKKKTGLSPLEYRKQNQI